ncbi:MAG TPA: DUF6662 family protein [Sphingomicrobium sp.]|nr:DUF6662 family protein [Sphingomicrobium sp.]
MNPRVLLSATIVVAANLLLPAAKADERYFGYTYSAETLPKGESELELWTTDRRGKADGHYDAQDYRIELEHGFTDRLTVASYVNFGSHHIRGLEPELEDRDRDFALEGAKLEFKYGILSPYKDGFGLALYAEPGWARINKRSGEKQTEYELEFKLLMQKNFMDDRLVWAGNLVFEPEWEREVESEPGGEREVEWEKELKLEALTGLSYRVAPRWFIGAEARYSSVYPDWTDGLHREAYAVFAGPSIHYGGGKWWFTASYMPQLFGSPSPGGSRHLEEFEGRELRLIVGLDF